MIVSLYNVCIELLQIRVLFEDILDQWVDVVAHGVDLRVDVMQVDLIRGHLVFFGKLELVSLSRFIFLILLSTGDFDALCLEFYLEFDTIRQLIQLGFDSLLSNHLRDDWLSLGCRYVELFAHGLIGNIQIDAWKNQDIVFE